MTKTKNIWMITVPEDMDVEYVAEKLGITVELAGTGIGSSEYTVETYREAQQLVKALKKEALNNIAIVGSMPVQR